MDQNTAPNNIPFYPSSYLHKSYTMILTVYNEEARVKRVVEYYRPFARMIVIDNFSTDGTASIVRNLGVKLVHFKNPGTAQTPECINFFFSLVDTDYILFLSCSEFMPVSLLELLEEIAPKKKYDVVSCVRDSYTCGELIPLWGGRFQWIEARVGRFINKNGIDVNKIVIHSQNKPLNEDRILYLPRDKRYNIIHLRDADAKSLIIKSADYAFVEAHHRTQKGVPITGFKLILLYLKEIVRFLHLPISKWNRIALREIWARMIMHSITYWVGWELRSGKTIEYSHRQNEELWQRLVAKQNDQGSKK
jgi:glycosyltransferase involved in cell wall biosynthesis